MPSFKIVTRDYRKLHQRFVALGPGRARRASGAHGIKLRRPRGVRRAAWPRARRSRWDGERLPSLREAHEAADAILHLAPETNGELAYRATSYLEEKTGVPLARPGRGRPRRRGSTYKDLQAQPRRLLNSPMLVRARDRAAAPTPPFTYNSRAARPLAHADRPAAPLPRPPRLHRLRRAPADLQAEAAARRSTATCGESARTASDAQLPHPARQVAHPLDLRRQPADDDALARRSSRSG